MYCGKRHFLALFSRQSSDSQTVVEQNPLFLFTMFPPALREEGQTILQANIGFACFFSCVFFLKNLKTRKKNRLASLSYGFRDRTAITTQREIRNRPDGMAPVVPPPLAAPFQKGPQSPSRLTYFSICRKTAVPLGGWHFKKAREIQSPSFHPLKTTT